MYNADVMPMHRTQLFLEPEQHEALERQARQQGRSISEVVREYVDLGLARFRAETERRLAVLDELARFRRRIGPICVDLVAEAREERQRQLGEVLLREREP